MEETVDRRPGAAQVGTEGAEVEERVDERGAAGCLGQVIGGESGEVPRAPAGLERFEKSGATLTESTSAAEPIEAPVDLRGRVLLGVVWKRQHEPEVLREVEECQALAGALSKLRPWSEEEGDVG